VKNYLFFLALSLVATVNLGAQTSADYPDSAKFLADECKKYDTSAIDAGYCLGYVSGVATSVEDCEGEHVTKTQEVKVFQKYIEDHPEELDKTAASVIRSALLKAFPCSK
jgi:Rap1a immunity proteins